MPKKRAIVCVTNDLFTDQRVDKVCRYLCDKNVDVLLVGRRLSQSKDISERIYKTHRLTLCFTKGALFYAEFNIRLFFFLLFNRFDFLVSNDLDTLPACDLAAASKGKKVIYDSHEYFTEVPELQNSPMVKKIWESFERMIFPNLNDLYTVNNSIAEIYSNKYHKTFKVVRNLPELKPVTKSKTKSDLNLPENKHILILQGAGINIQRGAEELTEAMHYLDTCFLIIIGSGDVFPVLKSKIEKDPVLNSRIWLIDKLPYEEMMQYTMNADIGFSLDKNTNPNYNFSLPNKIFDYFKAGVPVIISDLFEISKVIREYNTGIIIQSHEPKEIAGAITRFLADEELYATCKRNCQVAIENLNWEKERNVLDSIYTKYL